MLIPKQITSWLTWLLRKDLLVMSIYNIKLAWFCESKNTCILVCTASKNFKPASYSHAIVWMLNNRGSLQPPYSLIQEPATNCWETQLLCSQQHCCIVVRSSVLLESTHLRSNQLKLYYVKLYGTFLFLILDVLW